MNVKMTCLTAIAVFVTIFLANRSSQIECFMPHPSMLRRRGSLSMTLQFKMDGSKVVESSIKLLKSTITTVVAWGIFYSQPHVDSASAASMAYTPAEATTGEAAIDIRRVMAKLPSEESISTKSTVKLPSGVEYFDVSAGSGPEVFLGLDFILYRIPGII